MIMKGKNTRTQSAFIADSIDKIMLITDRGSRCGALYGLLEQLTRNKAQFGGNHTGVGSVCSEGIITINNLIKLRGNV